MIARIFFILIPLIWLPAYYAYRLFNKGNTTNKNIKKILWWLAPIAFTIYTCILATEKGFIPKDNSMLYTYLFLLGVWIIPKALWAISSFLGLWLCHLKVFKRNYGNAVGMVLAFSCIFIVVYGSFITNKTLKIEHQDIYFEHLPKAFNGYKIVHVSDLHVGTYTGKLKPFLARTIDSINAQQADAVMFTGDLQNIEPSELIPHTNVLSSIKAKDGIFSVLGNHDYADYIYVDAKTKARNEAETERLEQSFGWKLLKNEHIILRKNSDSLIIAGGENDAPKAIKKRTNVAKAIKGVNTKSFVLLLQHDPIIWEKQVLNHPNIALTLSGHTHGGQIKIGNFRITQLTYNEDAGLYRHKNQQLYVSTGVGGVIPFRFGIPPTITVITLHKKK